jgi:hypothetical protein
MGDTAKGARTLLGTARALLGDGEHTEPESSVERCLGRWIDIVREWGTRWRGSERRIERRALWTVSSELFGPAWCGTMPVGSVKDTGEQLSG